MGGGIVLEILGPDLVLPRPSSPQKTAKTGNNIVQRLSIFCLCFLLEQQGNILKVFFLFKTILNNKQNDFSDQVLCHKLCNI